MTYSQADSDPGRWCPSTPGRDRIASLDQIISEELARRCGLKSYREAHPEEPQPPKKCACGCGVELSPKGKSPYASRPCRALVDQRRALMGHRKLTFQPGTRFGSRVILREVPERSRQGWVQYEVQCDCGKVNLVPGWSLKAQRMGRCRECVLRDLRERLKLSRAG